MTFADNTQKYKVVLGKPDTAWIETVALAHPYFDSDHLRYSEVSADGRHSIIEQVSDTIRRFANLFSGIRRLQNDLFDSADQAAVAAGNAIRAVNEAIEDTAVGNMSIAELVLKYLDHFIRVVPVRRNEFRAYFVVPKGHPLLEKKGQLIESFMIPDDAIGPFFVPAEAARVIATKRNEGDKRWRIVQVWMDTVEPGVQDESEAPWATAGSKLKRGDHVEYIGDPARFTALPGWLQSVGPPPKFGFIQRVKGFKNKLAAVRSAVRTGSTGKPVFQGSLHWIPVKDLRKL